MSRAVQTLILGGRCNLRCSVCDCWDSAAPLDEDGVPRALREGGEVLVFRGEAAVSPRFERALAAARSRFGEVWIRTNGQLFPGTAAAERLKELGARGVIVPFFSHQAAVHDQIAQREGAHAAALRALRSLAQVGLVVSIEAPLLSDALQDLGEIVRTAHRQAGGLGNARFYVPVRLQPPEWAPPRFSRAREVLVRAFAACAELSVPAAVSEFDGIPLCALGHDEALQPLYRFDPRRAVGERPGFAKAAVCGTCRLAAHCAGVTDAYRAAHGEADLVPFRFRPRKMVEQRTTPRRQWTESQRESARRRKLLVLRPTIHCNQDCTFCSANETSENQLDKGQMLRRIARAARSGVEEISFSGGEPTLSRDLVHYVRAATRLGIRRTELVTNGVLLDVPEKVRPLVEAGLHAAFVSLHAHDEALSRRMTQKVGEWERTVRAITLLSEAGVIVDVNHVITPVNYPYLPRFARFVWEKWGGKVGISFAFVTPQFRALERAEQVPRYTDVLPWLRRAMRFLADRGARFTVGSRQGIPPCLLGPYAAWSDVFAHPANAVAEDAPQKVRAPACDACRYTAHCTGIRRHYAERYGTDELVPVTGSPWSAEEVSEIYAAQGRAAWRFTWDTLPAPLRASPPAEDLIEVEPPPAHTPLPLMPRPGERVLRIAMLGSGPQAVRLAMALAEVPGFSLVGVASPHLPDRDPGPWTHVPRFADPVALFDQTRPDAVIVAAATVAHHPLALAALGRGLPVLVEKPLALTVEQASDLVRAAERGLLVPAHAMLFSPGVRALRAELADPAFGKVTRASVLRRDPSSSPDAPALWSRDALFQALYHSIYLLGGAVGRCDATVEGVEHRGAHRPEWIRALLSFPGGERGEIVLDYAAPLSSAELAAWNARGERRVWRRVGAEEVLVRSTPGGDRTSSVERGSDTAGLLAAFREAVLSGGPPPVLAADARDAMAAALAVVEALAPALARPGAPKHAASPAMVLR